MIDLLRVPGNPLTIQSEILGTIGQFPIRNTETTAVLDWIFFIFLMLSARNFRMQNPGRFQIAVEMILTIITGLINQIVGDEKKSKKIVPVVTTLTLFLLVSNLITMLVPFISGFTYNSVPLFRTHTNDFNTTVALSFSMIFLGQVYSVQSEGVLDHIFKYFQIKQVILAFRKSVKQGLLAIINAFVGLLDIVSEFAKVISLSLRLFGNIFAGELLIGVFMSMLAVGLPIPIMILSLLSGVIQSIVFGSIVASNLSVSISD